MRDLLALEVDGRSLLSPTSPIRTGFDNVASVLSVSPALLESYLSAASTVSRLAVGDPTLNPVVDTFKVPTAMVQDDRAGERPAVRIARRHVRSGITSRSTASTRSRSC